MSERQPIVEHDGNPHYEDINTPVIFMLTVIAAIVTYALVAAITGLYFQMKNAQLAAINATTVTMAAQEIAEQKAMLAAGDEEKNIKPIDQAMKQVVTDLGGQWQLEDNQAESDSHSEHGAGEHPTTDSDDANHEESTSGSDASEAESQDSVSAGEEAGGE